LTDLTRWLWGRRKEKDDIFDRSPGMKALGEQSEVTNNRTGADSMIKIERTNDDWLTEYRAYSNGAEIALLQLTESDQPGKLHTEFIEVKKSARGQGIASRLLDAARADLGYTPAPHWILDTTEAQSFWSAKGFPTNIPASNLTR
jgi:ribosomal protein S18 acetylase RimI-like enzyme